jgi:uncharacterized LabA/DUF88 family protein
MANLTLEDVMIDIRQKGVDMRIGVDVSSLAFKKQVGQIVLIAGDAGLCTRGPAGSAGRHRFHP